MERGAPADLWRHTLSEIQSMFGRLIYLSSLRVENGTYEHYGLIQVYGFSAAQVALLNSHEQAFETWLTFSVEQQKADLDLYLSGLMPERAQIIDNWLRQTPYSNLMPFTARESERRLFRGNFGMLLELLRREMRLERPDPER